MSYDIEKFEINYCNGIIEYVDTQKEAKQKAIEFMKDYIKRDDLKITNIVFDENEEECILLVKGDTYDSIDLSGILMTEELWEQAQAHAIANNNFLVAQKIAQKS